jgi:hypothetical protein
MGIDPMSLIVAALAAGASAAAKDTAGQAIKDAYNGLKGLIGTRFKGRPEAEMVLAQHEAAPETWEAPLKATLKSTGADQDAAIVEAAQKLDTLVRQAAPAGQTQNIADRGGTVVAPVFGGSISGSAIGIAGRDLTGSVSASTGVSGQDLRQLFEPVLAQVRARPADPNVPNAEIQQKVVNIRDEVARGEGANAVPVARWLGELGSLAPDVRELVAATLREAGGAVSAAVRQLITQGT